MYPEERRQVIVQRARADGRVDVAETAFELNVTPETVRRDLTALERQGVLRRVHGGAIPVERLGFEPAVAVRSAVLVAEKERIAKAALAELPEAGAILIDAGTTTARFADVLPADRELTVVTNSLPIAMSLAARPNLTLLTIGGRVRGRTLATVDNWALQSLAEIGLDVAFVATNGISLTRGLTTPDPAEAAVKRAILGSAPRAVLLADHTKFGVDHFARFGNVDQLDVVVTDSGLDERICREIESAGPRVVLA